MSRSSSTAVAPPSGHQRPPSTSRTRALLLCQRARWPDPTPRSPPGGPLQGQRPPSAPLDAGPGSRRARRCSRPESRGGGTPAATGRAMCWPPHCELPYVAGKHTGVAGKQTEQQELLPVCCPRPHSRRRPGRRRSVSPGRTHETPGDSRVRALPSPYRARAVVSPGVSCRGARSHAGWGASTGTEAGLWMTLGTSRAEVLTGAGMAVDNPVDGWGRPPERENSLLPATCSEAREGPVDRKKLRTGCRDPVRYSGR